jgi:hypothetical protein
MAKHRDEVIAEFLLLRPGANVEGVRKLLLDEFGVHPIEDEEAADFIVGLDLFLANFDWPETGSSPFVAHYVPTREQLRALYLQVFQYGETHKAHMQLWFRMANSLDRWGVFSSNWRELNDRRIPDGDLLDAYFGETGLRELLS